VQFVYTPLRLIFMSEQTAGDADQGAIEQGFEDDWSQSDRQLAPQDQQEPDQENQRSAEQETDGAPTQRLSQKDDDSTCFVGNIGPRYNENDLRKFFSVIAQPKTVRVVRDGRGYSKGVAFVGFESKEVAQKAIEHFKNNDVEGRRFHIKLASEPLSPPNKKRRKNFEDYSYNRQPYRSRYEPDRYHRERPPMRGDRYGPPRDYRDDDIRRNDRFYRPPPPPPPPPRGRRYDRRYDDDRDYYRDERGYDDHGMYDRRYDQYERDRGDYYSGHSRDYQTGGYEYDGYGHSSSMKDSSLYAATSSHLNQYSYPANDIQQSYMMGGTSSGNRSSVSFPEPK
jgi:RNA recognition motif-containing protein